MLDLLRYIAIGMGLVIIFAGFILVILAESAPERMIDFLETLALALLGRRPPRRRRIYAVPAPAEQRTEVVQHEHHELVIPNRRKRRIPWRLVGGVVVPALTVLMGYPLVHQTARIAKTDCPPTVNSEVLLHARHMDDSPSKSQGDRPCAVAAGDGFCGLVERNVPFLETILVALHVCPEQAGSRVMTVEAAGPDGRGRADLAARPTTANPALVRVADRAGMPLRNGPAAGEDLELRGPGTL